LIKSNHEPVAVSVSELIEALGPRVISSKVTGMEPIAGPSAIIPGASGTFSFCTYSIDGAQGALRETASSLVLVKPELVDVLPEGLPYLSVANPRLEFARLVAQFFHPRPVPVVHLAAHVDPSAIVGEHASIGAGAVIESGIVIGDRATIDPNAVIVSRTTVGDYEVIGPGTCIGYVGFGYERDGNGNPVLMPHLGGVQIGHRVEIGANTAIDRGTLGPTVIEDDVKSDNLVHIAHNCRIESGGFVIATAILCGGCG